MANPAAQSRRLTTTTSGLDQTTAIPAISDAPSTTISGFKDDHADASIALMRHSKIPRDSLNPHSLPLNLRAGPTTRRGESICSSPTVGTLRLRTPSPRYRRELGFGGARAPREAPKGPLSTEPATPAKSHSSGSRRCGSHLAARTRGARESLTRKRPRRALRPTHQEGNS